MKAYIPVRLTDDQRTELNRLIRAGNAPARVQTRARILLLVDYSQEKPLDDVSVGSALLCHKNTVSNVRRRFARAGLKAALHDKPMPPRPPKKITGEVEAHLIALACSPPPNGRARWTLRLLAHKMVELGHVESLSNVAVLKRLKKTNSSPGR